MQLNTNNSANGNGNRLAFVLIGIFMPPLLAGTIGWITTANTRMTAHTERIAVIESQLKDTRDELQRINVKLDKLLDQQRRP
jgi:hypothetical protein